MAIILGQYSDKHVDICLKPKSPNYICPTHVNHITVEGVESYKPSWSKHFHKLMVFLNNNVDEGNIVTVVEDVDSIVLNHFQPKLFDETTVSDILKHTVEDTKKYGLGEPDYAYTALVEQAHRLAVKLREETKNLAEETMQQFSPKNREVLLQNVEEKRTQYLTLLETVTLMFKDMETYVLNNKETWEHYTVMLPSEIVERIRKRNISLQSSLVQVKRNSRNMFIKTLHTSYPLTSSVKHVFTHYDKLEGINEPSISINVKTVGKIVSPNVEIYHWVKLTPAVTDLIENYVNSSRLNIMKEAQLTLNVLLHVGSQVNKTLNLFIE